MMFKEGQRIFVKEYPPNTHYFMDKEHYDRNLKEFRLVFRRIENREWLGEPLKVVYAHRYDGTGGLVGGVKLDYRQIDLDKTFGKKLSRPKLNTICVSNGAIYNDA